jgi:hypothetical protein
MSEGHLLFWVGAILGACFVLLLGWGKGEYLLRQCAEEHDVFRCEIVTTYRPVEVSQ